MIIFIDDDDAYRRWLDEHPDGFVVNTRRKPDAKYLILHRASCPDINSPREGRWTTDYIKWCASDVGELEHWAIDQIGANVHTCGHCHPKHRHHHPATKPARPTDDQPHLTKLGGHIVDYLLELAVISLDGEQRYADRGTTVADMARYFEKTPAQLTSALRRLQADDYVHLGDSSTSDAADENVVVYPSAKAMRTLPFFASMDDQELQASLARLRS